LQAGTLIHSPRKTEDDEGPLLIARQGSLEAGGKVIHCLHNDGGDPGNVRYPAGAVSIEHVYASYQYPVDLRYPYPILFNPGGGHSARVYDTTPDGREGWLTLFLRHGFATYGVDRVNTGRSGSDIDAINAVKLGTARGSALPSINRYSHGSCWVTFRWGPRYGEVFKGSQFPIEHVQEYYRQTIPTYRDASEVGKSVAAFAALIDKIGSPVILQSWSSSGLLIYLTAIERPERVKAILAVETSTKAFSEIPMSQLPVLAKIPIYMVIGDHAQDRVVASREFAAKMASLGGRVTVDVLPEAGIFGNGHTLMLERNNKEIMSRMIDWLDRTIFERAPEDSDL
jgi:pimeloyl-ACP methyl ester carboxylesterase